MLPVAARAVALMALSGFAALGYQIAWTQQSALWLGHDAAAVLAVVAAFFGGLAAGSFVLGGRIERSARPARWYAACEAAIGAWALVLAFAMRPASDLLLALIGADPGPLAHWSIAFAGTFLLLLPATAAMGATMPAMERILHGAGESPRRVALVYAANTAGAIGGVIGAAFWMVPGLGLRYTAIGCAALSLLCALGALALPAAPAAPPSAAAETAPPKAPLVILAATGFLGIGYEVLVVRALSQVNDNSVFTFAILLAVYLAGTALGAEAWRRRGGSRDGLLATTAAACALGVLLISFAGPMKAAVENVLGRGFATALASEALVAALAFVPPTLAMGALFSQLATDARSRGVSFARALGVNTLGAAAAPIVFGLVALPMVGLKATLIAVAAGYLVLVPPHAWMRHAATAALAVLVAVAALSRPLPAVDLPAGARLVSSAQGALGHVTVVADAQGALTLHIDNREREGSSATRYADARQATLPLALHPAPHRALFLGLGSGVTAYSAAQRPGLQVDAVELLPEVIDASRHFTRDFTRAPRLVNADARRFVRASGQSYDVIVADNFHPARAGSASLYTPEHFAAVKARLAPGGVFCQWLPLHQLDLGTMSSIVRAFRAAFPDASAMLATYSLETPVVGLVGHADGAGRAPASMPLEVLGAFFAGPAALARFAEDGEPNTDDRPSVAYRAPRLIHTAASLPRDRLIILLHRMTIDPAEIAGPARDRALDGRLVAYRTARDRFIEAGLAVVPTDDVRGMLAQAREPLLHVLETSPDFRPAYDPLLRMAVALAPQDPVSARELLTRLDALQPARPEAREALRTLPR